MMFYFGIETNMIYDCRKKIILIVGHTGFVGQAVKRALSNEYSIFKFSRTEVDKDVFDIEFDMIINCAGCSWKYRVNQFTYEALINELEIFELLCRLKFKKIIHISSIDALGCSNYGRIKRLVEIYIQQKFKSDCIIVRLAGLIGHSLKKNPIFDMLNDFTIYANSNSMYNYVTTTEVGTIIKTILDKDIKKSPIDVGASQNISVNEIAKLLGKNPKYYNTTEVVKCHIDTNKLNSFFQMKTSKEYIMDFLKNE